MGNWHNIDMREHIRESNLIEDVRGTTEIEQSLTAWKYLMEQETLTHEVIQGTQRLVVANQNDLTDDQRGHYRDRSRTNVTVGSYTPPRWQFVADLMDDWLATEEARPPWLGHVYFEGIHPFVDGNGRVGRMLMWRRQILLERQPYLFRASQRHEYYRKLDWYRMLHAGGMLLNPRSNCMGV